MVIPLDLTLNTVPLTHRNGNNYNLKSSDFYGLHPFSFADPANVEKRKLNDFL